MRIHYIKRAALSLCAAMSLGLSATSQVSQSVTNAQNAQAEPLTPPYSETFADESFLESYTIIDSNQDGTKWEPYFGKVQISYNSELAMDDWLITPALNLEGGKMYSFSVNILTGNETTHPGESASFNVRGQTSINGGSPLVLIDGSIGDINMVNPNDVDNISVIKDASAAA